MTFILDFSSWPKIISFQSLNRLMVDNHHQELKRRNAVTGWKWVITNLKKKWFFTLVGRKLPVINFGRIDDAKVSMGNWRNLPLLIYNCPPLRITNIIPFKYPRTASLFKHHDFWYFEICRLMKTELIYNAIASLAPSRAISSPPCLGSSPRHN